MTRLTVLLLTTFVAFSLSKPVYIIVFNAEAPNELDLHNLPAPEKIVTVNSKDEAKEAVEKIEAEKKDATISMNLSYWLLLVGFAAFGHATQEISFVSVNGDGSDGEPEDNDAYCKTPCDKKYENEDEGKNCFEGCRLALIYRFFDQNSADDNAVASKCKDGCSRSFLAEGKTAIAACSEGCEIKAEMAANGMVRLELTDKDATFDVASDFVNNPLNSVVRDIEWSMDKIGGNQNQDSNEIDDIFGLGDEDPVARFFKKFENARRRMENSFRVFETDPFFVPGKSVKVERPSGHELAAFNGKPVGNEDVFGQPIIQSQVIPDFSGKSDDLPIIHTFHLPSDEDAFQQRVRESEQLAIRNERIAQIGHYGVKLILLVLFIVLLVVALAMLRHHSMMSYRHLNEKTLLAAVAVTPKNAEAGPLPEKSADNIYVAAPVHGSPPPAYDQLSIKKVQQ
ncbi:hypothetical protein QR680_004185 [Steinernema hermaphroditum]|uniref:WSC domain-containing protein n=1 Tax=Steinernema hermaphroditum TaxID=289476 RepID=A0AA39LTB1_9BILA|nr:hypothetical protein QR680_004185 [Steinernema hermaphroditum]